MIRWLWLLTLFPTLALAQTVTGSLVGHVGDQSGASVFGARVRAVVVDRGTSREAVTNEEGNYTISSMDPGIYRIEIATPGFKKFVRDRANVEINTTIRVDAGLELGSVEESVQVSGQALTLQTDRGDLNQQIRQEQVENLPLSPDRNYQALLELVPGSTEPDTVGSSFGNPGGSLANFVNGQNNRGNSFQIDGTINNQTNVTSQTAIVPPAEAIQVVDISSNAYDAEQGRATGAMVNVGIKSGTNDLHGSVFYYNVNSALKARNSFSTLNKAKTNLTQFGFTLGGPIVRNRTFFFGDYQGGRDRRGESFLLDVPTAAFRQGNFAASPNRIFDPETGTGSGANRAQFESNIIPQSRISPVAKKILDRLPLPNREGLVNNYETSGGFAQDRDAFDVKVNHRFTDATDGFIRYSYFAANTSDPPAFGVLGGPTAAGGSTAAIGPSRIQSASANLTRILSPELVTEFRAGLVRVLIQGESPTDPGLATQVGIPGINNGDFFNRGIPRITISGYTFLGAISTLPFKIAETSSNFVNNWTKQKGNHTIRFGADLRNLILNNAQANGDARGLFSFTAGVTGTAGVAAGSSNAFAAFLLGLPQQIDRTSVIQPGGYRIRQYYFFAQDRWQATARLTFNYGLRYEIYPYALGANPGNQSRYLPLTNQLVVAGYGPVNQRLNIHTDYKDFAPRLGLAFRLTQTTVIRGGYGLGYIPIGLNQVNPRNYPSQVSLQFRGANAALPIGNIADGIPLARAIDASAGIVNAPPGNVVLGVMNPDPRRGYVQSFNFTIEQQVFRFVTSASYVGTLGTRLPGVVNLNAASPGATVNDRPLARLFGRTADTFYSDFMLSSAYHALQARAERRFRKFGNATVSYTWSKSLDYTDAFSVVNDLNLGVNRGPSSFDRAHNMVASHVVRIPKVKIQFGGIFSARTGTPIDITGVRLAANAPQGTTNRPDVIATPRILGGVGPGTLWFDTSAFVEPAPGTFGNVGRNTVRGPGYTNYNLNLARTFRITEHLRAQLTGAAFNLTNTAHYRNPSGSFTSSFGQIRTTFGERQLRLGARFMF